MPEAKLKEVVAKRLEQALSIRVCAMKELVTAEDVAKAYVKALQEIKSVCEKRNRY